MSPSENIGKKSIIIVGAGLSGLQAANILLNDPSAKLFDLRVLEASGRIGGRLSTKKPWGVLLDYGASYIHGTEENPLTQLVEAVQSTFIPRHRSDLRVYYDQHGVSSSQSESSLIYRKVSEYSDAASLHSRTNVVDRNTSVGSFYKSMIARDTELRTQTLRRLVSNGLENLSHSAGCDLDQLSLKYYWTDDDLPGDRVFIDSTYNPILQYIAQPALEKGVIHFNTQISHIDITSSHDRPIILKSTTEETFHADVVIVTIPLGCLKRNAITFSPPLPLRIQASISNLGYGLLERIFLRFSRAWWQDTQNCNNSTVGVDFYRFPSLASTAEVLPRGMLNFFSLARTHQPQPVLGVFAASELAEYLVSLSKDALKTIIQQFYIPHFPNYDANNADCQIRDVENSSWSRDPLSGYGAYTHIPVGSDNGEEDLEILSEKIVDAGAGGILFAGEHATKIQIVDGLKYANMATVTGAFQSGTRAAKDALEMFDKGNDE